jgi:arylsulfatase
MMQNVLLVTYDCVRADVAWRGFLPALEALRATGRAYRRAVSSAPLTPVSHATIFTGLQPYHHGVRHLLRESLPADRTTLAEVLAQEQFVTAAVVACPGLDRWYGLDRGFGHYDDELPPLPGGGSALEVADVQLRGLAMKRADVVAARGEEWLSRRRLDERWFLFLHFFDAHWPYDPPVQAAQAANAYEGEVAYADSHFRRILAVLDGMGLRERTLIVLLSDHGEDLAGWYPNDKSGVERGHPEERGHGCLLYEVTQHVPLIFSHPALPPGEVDTPVGLVDVAPTICGLLGLTGRLRSDGIDLSPYLRRGTSPPPRPLFAETLHPGEVREHSAEFASIPDLQARWLPPTWKVIRAIGDANSAQVFDLSRDPCEEQPLPAQALPAGTICEWPADSC